MKNIPQKLSGVIKNELNKFKNPEKAKILSGFFKTGKGEYGEGDKFIGIMVPEQRSVAKKFAVEADLKDLNELLSENIHEYRLTALFILTEKYKKASAKDKERETIAKFYLKNAKRVNNWDLVDSSAPHILGDYFFEKDRATLYKLAKSKNLWERRIAMLATLGFISKGDFRDTFKIAEILLADRHDLIHKAVGWMLREVGKINQPAEEEFLRKHYREMPRTMLRYAIEKFSEDRRKFYLTR